MEGGHQNLELTMFIRLKKTFHFEKQFSPNKTPLHHLPYLILNFKMCQKIIERPIECRIDKLQKNVDTG